MLTIFSVKYHNMLQYLSHELGDTPEEVIDRAFPSDEYSEDVRDALKANLDTSTDFGTLRENIYKMFHDLKLKLETKGVSWDVFSILTKALEFVKLLGTKILSQIQK